MIDDEGAHGAGRGASDRFDIVRQPRRVAFGDQSERLGIGCRDGFGDSCGDHRGTVLGGADLAVLDWAA